MDTNNIDNNHVSVKEFFLKFASILKYYKAKWKVFLITVLIFISAALLYSRFKAPLFTATCTFVLDDGGGGSSLAQYAGLASMVGLDMGGSKNGLFQSDNIIELYKSQKMLKETLLSPLSEKSQGLLIDRYILFKHLRQKWETKPALKNLRFKEFSGQPLTRIQDSVIKAVIKDINKNYLTVGKVSDNASIIKVETKAPDEIFAKEFNDKVVNNVNDFYKQTKVKVTLQNVSILKHQTDSVRRVLNGAINQTVSVNDATPNLNITRQVLRVPAQKAQLTAEANKAILSELVKNLELAKITLQKETPLIQVVDSPSYPLEKKEITPVFAIIVAGLAGLIFTAFVLLFYKLFKDLMANNSEA